MEEFQDIADKKIIQLATGGDDLGDERNNENDNNLMVLFVFNMNSKKIKACQYQLKFS